VSEGTEKAIAALEAAVERALGARLRSDEAVCRAMWSALANIDWTHADGSTVGYTFRGAGHLVAEIRGEGNYMDWYCSGPYATVSEEIEAAMAREGWTHRLMPE